MQASILLISRRPIKPSADHVLVAARVRAAWTSVATFVQAAPEGCDEDAVRRRLYTFPNARYVAEITGAQEKSIGTDITRQCGSSSVPLGDAAAFLCWIEKSNRARYQVDYLSLWARGQNARGQGATTMQNPTFVFFLFAFSSFCLFSFLSSLLFVFFPFGLLVFPLFVCSPLCFFSFLFFLLFVFHCFCFNPLWLFPVSAVCRFSVLSPFPRWELSRRSTFFCREAAGRSAFSR